MNKEISIKTLRHIGFIYGLIVSVINYLGYLIVSSQNMPMQKSDEYEYWVQYINNNRLLIDFLAIGAFVIPGSFCIIYILFCKKEKIAAHIINLPLIYSLIGGSGWGFSVLFQVITLLSIRLSKGVNMHSIAMTSFLNMVQCCIFITTLTFMILNTIHRLYVLPKYFPDGNLLGYKGSIKISTRIILTVFFISTAIFPVFYIVAMFRNYSLILGFEIEYSIYYMLIGIIILGFILLSSITSYFSTPLNKLGKATENIQNGIYDKKIDVISNDDIGTLADSFNNMAASIDQKNKRIIAIQDSIIRGMAVMVDSRDSSTGGHVNRTSECVRVFINKIIEGKHLNITEEFANNVIKAAPMHDLGKIAVDDAILRKPGKFLPEEYEIMKKHSAEGARIVKEVLKESDDKEFEKVAVNVAHYHHEKWDGSGYPTKISGTDIPLEARIMALADVFDALVSKRYYKDKMDYDKAFNIIEESLGSHFDPDLGAYFIACRDDIEALYNVLPE